MSARPRSSELALANVAHFVFVPVANGQGFSWLHL